MENECLLQTNKRTEAELMQQYIMFYLFTEWLFYYCLCEQHMHNKTMRGGHIYKLI